VSALDDAPMLAGLIAQAEARGADLVTLRAMIEEASEVGAARAMERLGLADGNAAADIAALRAILQGWREARRSAANAAVTWTVRGGLAALLGMIALKLHLTLPVLK